MDIVHLEMAVCRVSNVGHHDQYLVLLEIHCLDLIFHTTVSRSTKPGARIRPGDAVDRGRGMYRLL